MGPRGDLLIYGAGGHAVSVAETALALGYTIVGFIDDVSALPTLLGRPVHARIPQEHFVRGGQLALAVGDNARRETLYSTLASSWPGLRLPVLIHPSSSVSSLATVGEGSVVLQGAVVGAGSMVGALCIVNSGAVLDHECTMADLASLAPNTAVGGRVRIGRRSAICIGATVKHGVVIGEDTIVGAQSYVNRDLENRVVAYGCPARVIRAREARDSYLD